MGSGLCDLGTDCHDCGPASKGNFTTFDDDGWWDDDENYWDDDYDWENYDSADDDAPHCPVSAVSSRLSPRDVAEARALTGSPVLPARPSPQARGLHQGERADH